MNKKCILVIEDNPFLLGLIDTVINRLGLEYSSATTVSEAEEKVLNGAFKLIISDIHLGNRTSERLISKIDQFKPSPILIAMSSDELILNRLKLKFNHNQSWDFISKNDRDWLKRISSHLEGFCRSSPLAELRFGRMKRNMLI